MTQENYTNEFQQIVNELRGLSANTPQEAKLLKKRIINYQKQIRLIKKKVNQDMKEMRAASKERQNQAGTGGAVFLSLLGKKGAARKSKSFARNQEKKKLTQTLQPYDELKQIIDKTLLELDVVKLSCDELIESANG